MVLVDSSLWILTASAPGMDVGDFVPRSQVVTCLPVVQEVLQGIRNEREFRRLRDGFLAMPILEPELEASIYLEAVGIYRTGRQLGYTIRSPNDCLIAACAIRSAVPLFHADHDFDIIARYTSLQSRNVMQ